MPTLKVKAYRYVAPVKASVKVVDNTFWAMGDANRDGFIDSTDIEKITASFGKRLGEEGFDPDCDLNNDGIINIKDATICSVNQGKVAPEFTTPFEAEVAVGKCTLVGTYKKQTLKAVADMKMANTKKVTFIFMTLFGRPYAR